jgi:hypothetical protein
MSGRQWNLTFIKLRKNAQVQLKKGNILRNLSVISQKNDLQKGKDSVSYGYRLIVETVFSYIKRMFGEYIRSAKWTNNVNELMLKASIYNLSINKVTMT